MKSLNIQLTSLEYNEILAKLANEIEDYEDNASDDLISSFVKIYSANLYPIKETTLIKKAVNKYSMKAIETPDNYDELQQIVHLVNLIVDVDKDDFDEIDRANSSLCAVNDFTRLMSSKLNGFDAYNPIPLDIDLFFKKNNMDKDKVIDYMMNDFFESAIRRSGSWERNAFMSMFGDVDQFIKDERFQNG